MKKRDWYLVCSIVAVVSYAVAQYQLSKTGNAFPDAVTYGWFAFWGSEIYHISRIKIHEKGDTDEQRGV